MEHLATIRRRCRVHDGDQRSVTQGCLSGAEASCAHGKRAGATRGCCAGCGRTRTYFASCAESARATTLYPRSPGRDDDRLPSTSRGRGVPRPTANRKDCQGQDRNAVRHGLTEAGRCYWLCYDLPTPTVTVRILVGGRVITYSLLALLRRCVAPTGPRIDFLPEILIKGR